MKKWDLPVLALIAALSLLPMAFFPRAGGSATVSIAFHGETIYSGPLDTDAVITTPDGKNEITVRFGEVRMTRVDCPDGLCLSAGAASPAKPVVCLPNGVVVTIQNASEDTDAVTY